MEQSGLSLFQLLYAAISINAIRTNLGFHCRGIVRSAMHWTSTWNGNRENGCLWWCRIQVLQSWIHKIRRNPRNFGPNVTLYDFGLSVHDISLQPAGRCLGLRMLDSISHTPFCNTTDEEVKFRSFCSIRVVCTPRNLRDCFRSPLQN